MGTFYETITLTNGTDRALAKSGYIPKDKIRSMKVDAMPDTGAWMLIINEEVRQQLGLDTVDHAEVTLADGVTELNDVTEPVEIRWKDRLSFQQAVVIPGAQEVLLGALPLEAMDLCVDPVHQCLIGAHGDKVAGIAWGGILPTGRFSH